MSPEIPQGAISGEELARVRPSVAKSWQLDGVGHPRGTDRLVGTPDGEARPIPWLFGRGDRDRAPVAFGLPATVAANRRTTALHRHPARGEPGNSRSHDVFAAERRVVA